MKERQKKPGEGAGVSSRLAEPLARLSRGSEPPVPAQTWHGLCVPVTFSMAATKGVCGGARIGRSRRGQKRGETARLVLGERGEAPRAGSCSGLRSCLGFLGAPKAPMPLLCQQGHPEGSQCSWGTPSSAEGTRGPPAQRGPVLVPPQSPPNSPTQHLSPNPLCRVGNSWEFLRTSAALSSGGFLEADVG